MKISRNTFCELLLALVVAGCGGGGDKKGTLTTNALGEYVTISGQVQNWNGVTGPVCPSNDLKCATPGTVSTDGSFAVPLPGGPSIHGVAWQSPCYAPDMGVATALAIDSFAFAGATVALVDPVAAASVHYVHVDGELIASSDGCAIDFKPGWNAYIDQLVTTNGTQTHNQYTGPIPPGAQWLVQ